MTYTSHPLEDFKEVDGKIWVRDEVRTIKSGTNLNEIRVIIQEIDQRIQDLHYLPLVTMEVIHEYGSTDLALVAFREAKESEVILYEELLAADTKKQEEKDLAEYKRLKEKFEKSPHAWKVDPKSKGLLCKRHYYKCTKCGLTDKLPWWDSPTNDWHFPCTK